MECVDNVVFLWIYENKYRNIVLYFYLGKSEKYFKFLKNLLKVLFESFCYLYRFLY